jgi:hypothetical protein
MAIKDWICDLMEKHRARFNPHDWPGVGSDEFVEYVKGWITAFALLHVGEDEAEAASRRLTMSPPNFRREHVPMLIDAIKQIRAEKDPVSLALAGGTREAAKAASRDCPYCGSEGLAPVFHPWPSPEHRVAPSAAAYCVCAHGRWIRKAHAETEPELLRKIIDLDCVLHGASVYLATDPVFAGQDGVEVESACGRVV